MNKNLRLFAGLAAPILAAGGLTSPIAAQSGAPSPEPAPVLTCTPADEWTALFDRAGQTGWLGADGIYSVALDGDDGIGSAGASTQTLFFFSDTLMGRANASGRVIRTDPMPNHSAAVLTGSAPDPDAIRFLWGHKGDADNRTVNLFGAGQWLFDCFYLKGSIYVFGFNQVDWKPSQIDMLRIPVKDGQPDFSAFSRKRRVPGMMTLTADKHYDFGMGILNNTAGAGVPDPDGYIYFYGYIDNLNAFSRKDLIVSRIAEADFPDFSKLTYYDGEGWGSDPTASAALIENVSCEMSVTPITGGPYKGKYIAVYTQGVQTAHMMYAIGDSPVGPFSEPVEFYTAPESGAAAKGGNGTLYTYNAKAHPHLSTDGRLLVSYNVNDNYGLAAHTYDYHPRFLWLDLQYTDEEIAALGGSAEPSASGESTETGRPKTDRPGSAETTQIPTTAPAEGDGSQKSGRKVGPIVAAAVGIGVAAGAAIGGALVLSRRRKRGG